MNYKLIDGLVAEELVSQAPTNNGWMFNPMCYYLYNNNTITIGLHA